jgi:hypothetical protein
MIRRLFSWATLWFRVGSRTEVAPKSLPFATRETRMERSPASISMTSCALKLLARRVTGCGVMHRGVAKIHKGPTLASVLTLTFALSAVAMAQSHSPTPELAIYDVDHLNAYTARVGWRVVYNVGTSTIVCRGEGSAIFLGGSHFITAAHVVDRSPPRNECAAAGKVNPFVEFGSTTMEAKIIAIQQSDEELGSIFYPDGMDLALLEVDARMMQPELRSEAPHRLCESDIKVPSTEAKISTQYGVYTAKTLAHSTDYSRMDFIAKLGDSGGGVFDKSRYCLMGIVSSGTVNSSNYVPTEIIRRFLDKAATVVR